MGNISDWWKDYLETNAQKEALEKKMKQNLEKNVDYLKLSLEHSYAVWSLSQKHQNILTKVNQHFDGKASRALMNRFIENIIHLQEIDRVYKANYEHVKLKQGFW
ncbi:hypothetical protein [Virgibacillus pantothenticus]|uniref:Uncharacterized protein n=1 Tax=Virgibacillus pantothenticus TaxID=1473 RepID=A0A0L0QLB0_VIRPA|nr:hypothetical protein [Virgibacillus pantothenticus]KNE19382.1 hypothetical protein AFK71_12825 [Virgibacillus pantothenticus]MED3738798.1 hypothetical protein [Virgibacillus pantothenticus]QTY15105.1 hypothetical protein KBP50_14440 [Virgibacillus pantothenticus]SIT14223.1 hypothetical protein SAMN05421787_12135 [Virgibacillus pantothenticus]